jgi:putative phage-type endonuclease
MERAAWLRWRKFGIGSSDAASIHGASPYKSRLELYEEKVADTVEDSPSNFVQQKGIDLEPIARTKFSANWNIERGTEETFEPKLIENEFMRASLDGSSLDGSTIIEIKFQGVEAHRRASEGIIEKRHYWIQIQHAMLVSGASVAYLVSIDEEQTIHSVEVLPDPEFQKLHIEECAKFWDCVTTKTPPPLTDEDYFNVRSVEIKKKVQEWKRLSIEIDRLDTMKEVLREQIIAELKHPRNKCMGVRICKIPGRAGAIDWQKAFVENVTGVDPKKYQKPAGRESWRMEVEK